MKYVSTRGRAPVLSFDDTLLSGLARDGGLYIPETWPRFSKAELRGLRGLDYAQLAARVIAPFTAGVLDEAQVTQLATAAYGDFGHPAVAPLKHLDNDIWLLELFHGPTLAFKDYGLQLLGRMFDHVLAQRGETLTIVGATSGDTGSAAIEACRDRDAINIFILYPHGRVSDVQRRQMTTVPSANVHCIAIDGSFDDCQDLVKALFNDLSFRDRYGLSAVNSINWARIMAQIAYYFWAAINLGGPDRVIDFAVPTGNFGNVYAGYAARKMGLPIERLVVGCNRNDILARYLASGEMRMAAVEPSLSPSMDIQVSSNFERLLADHYGGNGAALTAALERFRRDGSMDFGRRRWQAITRLFQGLRVDDDETQQWIARFYGQTGELLDPHSVIGAAAALQAQRPGAAPLVSLATAHPAKFPDAVKAATGVHPALPARLSDLLERPERFVRLPADFATVRAHVAARAVAR